LCILEADPTQRYAKTSSTPSVVISGIPAPDRFSPCRAETALHLQMNTSTDSLLSVSAISTLCLCSRLKYAGRLDQKRLVQKHLDLADDAFPELLARCLKA